MNIAFRVDSSNIIGAGHVKRCLKLAEDLRYKSTKIIFISKKLNGNFNNLVKRKRFKTFFINDNLKKSKLKDDFNDTKKICKKFKTNILIIDSYTIDNRWKKKIKKHVDKVVVIDDFTKKRHYCDLAINNFNTHTNNLTGLDYVIIPNVYPKKIKKSKKITIGTFFGSTDSQDINQKILKVLKQKEFKNYKFINILGKNNINKNKILKDFKKYKNFNIEKKFINMKNFFKKIDILISSGGVTSFEALSSNISCINIPVNFYQKTSTDFQKKSKISKILNYKKISNKKFKKLLIKFIKTISKKKLQFDKKLHLDGLGTKRIAEMLIPSKFSDVSFKKAKGLNDSIELFKLYNEQENIKNSFTQKEVSFQSHNSWFKKKISLKKTFFYLFKIRKLCVGQVRIDIIKNKIGVIDYSLNKIFRGRGWGKLILRRAMYETKGRFLIDRFHAKVKKGNFKSVKIFNSLFFSKKNKKKYIEFNK